MVPTPAAWMRSVARRSLTRRRPAAALRADAAVDAGAGRIPWTSLRNGFYAHSLQWMAGPWRETGVISVPGGVARGWTRGRAGGARTHDPRIMSPLL